MDANPTGATARERRLFEAARGGDEDAFRRLVEPHRKELYAHCYRMLGSVHDADDALQEALLRAWRGLARFEGRSSLRSWLYRITTNACLDVISRRPKRVLPLDHGPAASPDDDLSEPLTESVWVEPYADDQLEDGYASPEARYERREGVELAFIAALQHLPASQRAALILRDVLGFSAREAAEVLETTVASANGALRRARKAVAERLPRQNQQATLRALGDDGVREVVERYIDAWERGDVDAILAMLAEDAPSRCRRFRPGTAAAPRSQRSSPASRSRIAGAYYRPAPTGSWHLAATPGMPRRGATQRFRSTCSPWMARGRRRSPHLSRRTRAAPPGSGSPLTSSDALACPTDLTDLERAGLPERRLKVTHFSPLSGQEDRPENYHTLLYELEERGGKTHLSLSQDNNASKEAAEHSQANWEQMLAGLKQVAERT